LRYSLKLDSTVLFPLTITATAQDSMATLIVDGAAVDGGDPVAIDTLAGTYSDSLTVIVVAEDGTTTSTYTIIPTPAKFPDLNVTVSDNPTEGYIYLADVNFTQDPDLPDCYLMILDEHGVPAFYRRIEGRAFDFKMHPNGLMSYYNVTGAGDFPLIEGMWVVLNSRFEEVMHFQSSDDYPYTDMHEFIMLPNGNAMFLIYTEHYMDMRSVGGGPNMRVIGLVIQEIVGTPPYNTVAFEWSNWDHFEMPITEDIHGPFVDHIHGNSLDIDFDGNILLSSKELNEITKINHTTGDIIWRLGGYHSDFTFVSDPLDGFSDQHCARRLDNGNLLLFDNGSEHYPSISRAVEYQLDTINWTATMVWEYRDGTTYAPIMGSVQRFANGNTLIAWGATNETIVEVQPDGTKVFEMHLPTNMRTYRAFKHPMP